MHRADWLWPSEAGPAAAAARTAAQESSCQPLLGRCKYLPVGMSDWSISLLITTVVLPILELVHVLLDAVHAQDVGKYIQLTIERIHGTPSR